MKKYVTGGLVIAWMIIIFLFSAQTATESSKTSQSVSYRIAKWQNDLFGQERTEEELLQQAEGMQLVIRKGAHMSEYALLALLLLFHLECYSFSKKKTILLALGCTVCYAATDEFHQLFVPGRAGRVTDVCIDSIGGLAGVIFYTILSFFRRIKSGESCKTCDG